MPKVIRRSGNYKDITKNKYKSQLYDISEEKSTVQTPIEYREDTSYKYNQPTTSLFYDNYVSPFCDLLVMYLPTWLTPNLITLCGLVLVGSSGIIVYTSENITFSFVIASIMWSIYGIIDNLDGKQARRLGILSYSGELIDHAVDSIVSSIVGLICQKLTNCFFQNTNIFVISYQLPFYFACWYHYVHGKLIIGNSINSKPILTVDELNIVIVPFLILLQYICPNIWDIQFPFIYFNLNSGRIFCYICTIFSIVSLSIWLYNELHKGNKFSNLLIIPIILYLLTKYIWNIPISTLVLPFSSLCVLFIFLKLSKFIERQPLLSLILLSLSPVILVISTSYLISMTSSLYITISIQLFIWFLLLYCYMNYLYSLEET
ncbi:ethanolaminephosphotransferase [Cryptosporidium andersoni]|uniref:Ethanolaminephosphotransferase n=1 Tax=Cryptosporidium andersoni TaxID=117008 RepID=A0A1J4MTE1_9CRYT|nr:ethanolaminephosphotransferase [Cryptosporidium andersoni]